MAGVLVRVPEAGELVCFTRETHLRATSIISSNTYSSGAPRIKKDTFGLVILSVRHAGRGGFLCSSRIATVFGIGWVFIDDFTVVS